MMRAWADMRVDDHTIHRLCVYFDSIESTQLSTIDITNIITVPYVGYLKAAALLIHRLFKSYYFYQGPDLKKNSDRWTSW